MLRMFTVLLTSLVSLSPALLLAQSQDDIGAAAGAGGCLACGGFLMFFVIGIIILNIALLVWVYRDATNRGMENPILWLVIVLIFGPLAAIVYLFVRAKGNLVPCSHCGAKRLDVSSKCPHCGNA
jgi:Phospholipase_D-nuclease N-terminal